jgi:hypothetical protein
MTDTQTPQGDPRDGRAQESLESSEFLRSLCDRVAADSAAIAKRIVGEIRLDHPDYERIDRAEHEEMARKQIIATLEGLSDRRLPSAAQVDMAHFLGGRRAEQGLPVEAVIGAYHVGCRGLWSDMLVRARAEDPEQAQRLLELVNLLLVWLRILTGAAADGYAKVARAREQIRTSLGLQFLQALYDGDADQDPTRVLAHNLDFDPNGEFQVICCYPNAHPTKDLDTLRAKLRSGGGKFLAVVREAAVVIVIQDIPATQVTELLGDIAVTAGVGLVRDGLAGAAESIIDAMRSLDLAERHGGIVKFEADWLSATLLPQIQRLRPLITPDQAVTQPHIRDAVQAYAEHGFSIAAGAQALHVHPNTMKYRLDRWEHLTGFDPRTLDGLLRSLLGIVATGSQWPNRSQPGASG